VRGYGAEIYLCEPTLEARQSTAERVVESTGGAFVHPSDDPLVISGQVRLVEAISLEGGACGDRHDKMAGPLLHLNRSC
jgi:hypothetical protein